MIHSLKMWEVQKHIALTGHSYNNAILVMNNAKFGTSDRRSEEDRAGRGKAAGALMRKIAADKETAQLAEIQAKGMQLTKPDAAKFRALMEPAAKKIAAYAGEDNVKKFNELVRQVAR